MSDNNSRVRLVAREYILPFILITSLFFMWGAARAVMDVLNKHFQLSFAITKTHSALMQTSIYGAYFLMAVPAGLMIQRLGTRIGVIIGLLCFAIGSLLFIPFNWISVFEYILVPLFVIGCGLVVLETAANPYVTLLGSPATSAGRLNLSQSFNGLGCIMGVLLGGLFFFDDQKSAGSIDIALPYTIIGIIVLCVALCFTKLKLPEVVMNHTSDDKTKSTKLGATFFFGFAALIAYEISEISINTFFINYMADDGFLSPKEASLALSIAGLGLFMVGRLSGSALMSRFRAENILVLYALMSIGSMILIILNLGLISKSAIIACYLFESIMFPTIFALAIRPLGTNIERASSILMMSVVGGAIGSLAMGYMSDTFSNSVAFVIPLAGFIVVLLFALHARHRAS